MNKKILSFLILFAMFGLFLPLEKAKAEGSDSFGVVGFVSSVELTDRNGAIDKITKAGLGWDREEITHQTTMDFAPYDDAYAKLNENNIKILGLLTHTNGMTHDQWKSYVTQVTTRYPKVAAWEIMNEADNYLSAKDYTVFLKEAQPIIKAANSSAKVVLTGITARPEATTFWDQVADAGGWNYIDAISMHIFMTNYPETTASGGDLLSEIERAESAVSRNGAKEIWVTEIGFDTGVVSAAHQGQWLTRALAILRADSKIGKIFIYRLYDNGHSFGILDKDLGEKDAFASVKSLVAGIGAQTSATKISVQGAASLDDFETVSSDWKNAGITDAKITLSQTTGKVGKAMKIDYTFNFQEAYAVVSRKLAIKGEPSLLSLWANGQGKNLKLRFTDSKNETFQGDLGSVGVGWQEMKIDLKNTASWVSWGGDGKIDYPVTFDSIVIDRQNGAATGSITIDDLSALTDNSDYWGELFGKTLAFWKTGEAKSANLCGAERNFTESVQFVANASCTSPATAAAQKTVDKNKSSIRLDGKDIAADGKSQYRLVVSLKDNMNQTVSNQPPSVILSSPGVVVTNFSLVGNEWMAYASSAIRGEVTAQVLAGSENLGNLKMVFGAQTQVAKAATETSATPAEEPKKLSSTWFIVLYAAGAAVLLGVVAWLLFRKR